MKIFESQRVRALSRSYVDFLLRAFQLHKKVQFLTIDFAVSWLQIIVQQKWSFLIIYGIGTLSNIFLTIPALLLEWLFRTQHYTYFWLFLVLWFVLALLEYVSDYYATKVHVRSVQSIHYCAMKRMLHIDPICHINNAKGRVIAKIYRAAESLEEVLRMGNCELLQTVIGAVTVIVTFLSIDITLGLLALGLLSLLSVFFIFVFMFTAHVMMPLWIDADDKVKNVATESLLQMPLIRATFSSDKIDDKLRSINKRRLGIESALWRSYYIIGTITKVLYVIIFGITGFYIVHLMQRGVLAQTTGIALLVTFFTGTYQLLQIGQFIYRFKVHVDRIHDFFTFMRTYGRQTFPVLEVGITSIKTAQDMLEVEARNIMFKYGNQKPIFDGVSLRLRVPVVQKNKLYGVIGFSGEGKSTLLSILGGQVRPQGGNVFVNGADIYAINDQARRGLIALQNQSNSGLYGTIKYNLTFGLPDRARPAEHELIALLERVGLWAWLCQKRGLDTVVSEGGLTLSGGQRQRLNFLSLYLRVKAYRPQLILIDEPTSSLDNASERAVNDMIMHMAQDALVIVVAHRLKTLEQAVGILDLSILSKSKEFTFKTHQELLQVSHYYQQLVAGSVVVESGGRAAPAVPLFMHDVTLEHG